MTVTVGPNLQLLINAAVGEEHYAALVHLLRGLDGLVQPRVLDKDLTTPPTIVDGAMYIVPASATGAWSGKTGQIARGFTVGTGAPAWEFYPPFTGWMVSVVDEVDGAGTPFRYSYNGTAWVKASGATAFTGLSDVPPDYTGAANYKVVVNGAGSGLTFEPDSAGATAFTGLSDVPSDYTGHALKGVRVNAAATGLEFYNEPVVIGVAWNGVPPANQVLGLFTAAFPIDFAVNIAGSAGIALVAATATTDITVNKIAASGHAVTAVGTVRFAAAGGAPTFIAASAFSLAAGDALQFKAPATPDATLADFSFSLAGVR